jgi:DNA-binding MarR family transcriptional regulator
VSPRRARGALLLNLNAAANLSAALVQRELDRVHVRAEHYGLLTEIRLAGRITPTDLSARTGIPLATLYDYTRELIKRGAVEIVPNPSDKRSHFLATTNEGTDAVLAGGTAIRRIHEAFAPHSKLSLEELEDAVLDLRLALEEALAAEESPAPA